jgi:hypothetical protein
LSGNRQGSTGALVSRRPDPNSPRAGSQIGTGEPKPEVAKLSNAGILSRIPRLPGRNAGKGLLEPMAPKSSVEIQKQDDWQPLQASQRSGSLGGMGRTTQPLGHDNIQREEHGVLSTDNDKVTWPDAQPPQGIRPAPAVTASSEKPAVSEAPRKSQFSVVNATGANPMAQFGMGALTVIPEEEMRPGHQGTDDRMPLAMKPGQRSGPGFQFNFGSG